MTTVIMISNDTSVIISNAESEESKSPSKWSPSSGSSGLASSSGSGSSPYQSAPPSLKRKEERGGGGAGRKKLEVGAGGRRKSSVSTVESDSEELAHSSCSTSSTLSSRTSGVSSGAASATYSSTPLHHWRQREALGERQFTTLNRSLPKPRPPGPVFRAKSFHVPSGARGAISAFQTSEHSAFQPSEHSAFQRLGGPRLGGQGTPLLTSTPHRPGGPQEGVSRARQGGHRREQGVAPPDYTRSLGRRLLTQREGSRVEAGKREQEGGARREQGTGRRERREEHVRERREEGTQSLRPAVLSNHRVLPRTDLSPINTNYARIYGGQGYCEPDHRWGEPVSSDSDYDTIYSAREESQEPVLTPIGSVFPSGCHRHPSKIIIAQPSRLQPLGCLNCSTHQCRCHSTHSISSTGESEKQCSSSRPRRFENGQPNARLLPFPHPGVGERLGETRDSPVLLGTPPNKPRRSLARPPATRSLLMGSKAKSFDGLTALLGRSSLVEGRSRVSRVMEEERMEEQRREEERREEERREAERKKKSARDEEEKKKKEEKDDKPAGPRRRGMGKLSGLSVSRSQILRRHTTYDKGKAVHIHSWHKQEDGDTSKARTSSLKRSVSRRSSSSSRLSLLSKKDEGEICITDAQSLDRLSLQSQEDQDEINLERYLQSAGRAAGWAKEFDSLLSDPSGLARFTEFLQQEFSHENIFFWCACERYRTLEEAAGVERLNLAREIVRAHLELGAPEPVNVDSGARAATARLHSCSSTSPPDRAMFLAAQRQIYNLMKFDSYPRFLKSHVYKECIRSEMSGGVGGELDTSPSCYSTVERRREEGGGAQRRLYSLKSKRRKSMSFWENWGGKESSQEKEEEEEATGGCTLTRVIFPDLATTVVSTTTGESIRALVSRLLAKRGLRLTSFDVFSSKEDGKPLDLSEDCALLHCTEVCVEARVLFRLELPSHKSIGVKAKQGKTVAEVLQPILLQYGWNVPEVEVYLDNEGRQEGERVDLGANVTAIDNKRLFVVQGKSHLDDREGGSETGQEPEMTLYEGLQIMRRGRFEDQRGTEICFEIPEFLRKPKEEDASKVESF